MNRFTIRTINGENVLQQMVDLHGRGGAFIPSSYETILTMNGAAQAVAMATGIKLGAGRLLITNTGIATEAIRVAFGTTEIEAQDNLTIVSAVATTGHYILSIADGGKTMELGVPELATHYAVANTAVGDTQDVIIAQGI